jgi:recombinational DNA repair protein (RecF pathway)
MYKDRGLIVKQIQYTDSSRILKCFTQEKGLITLFVRIPKKGSARALIQTGSFLHFTVQSHKKGSMMSPKEIKWDANIPNQPLALDRQATWLFSLELLQKALVDEFPLAHLHERMYQYYVHLLHDSITNEPAIPLLNIAAGLGVIDLAGISPLLSDSLLKQLNTIGWTLPKHKFNPMKDEEIFNTELERFLSHFGIQQLESLELL